MTTPAEADPEVSPKCTDFCTGNGQARGHRITPDKRLMEMSLHLFETGLPVMMKIPDEDLRAAVHYLYRNGYGYNEIADVLGREHEDIYNVITRPPES
jgi:hypothetical protein